MFCIIVKSNFAINFIKKFELQKNISQINRQPAEKLFLKRLRRSPERCQAARRRQIQQVAPRRNLRTTTHWVPGDRYGSESSGSEVLRGVGSDNTGGGNKGVVSGNVAVKSFSQILYFAVIDFRKRLGGICRAIRVAQGIEAQQAAGARHI